MYHVPPASVHIVTHRPSRLIHSLYCLILFSRMVLCTRSGVNRLSRALHRLARPSLDAHTHFMLGR